MLKKHGSNLDAEGNNDEKMKMKNRNIETLTSIHNAFIVTPISKANRNVAFIRPPAVTRRALWIRICPSFHLKVFLGLTHYFFEKLSMVLGFHILLSVKQKYFCPKMGKMGLKWARKRFFFWIYWKMWLLIFSDFDLWRKFILFVVFLHKSFIW